MSDDNKNSIPQLIKNKRNSKKALNDPAASPKRKAAEDIISERQKLTRKSEGKNGKPHLINITINLISY